jgi:hypothetical protein
MEPTEEFSTTPLSDIRSALERIELIVNELNDKTDQIYYAQDREELMKQIKNLGNVIQLLSDQIGVLQQENGRLIKNYFEALRTRLDRKDYEDMKAHGYILDIINRKCGSMESSFIFIFRNFILLTLFVLLFYIAAK